MSNFFKEEDRKDYIPPDYSDEDPGGPKEEDDVPEAESEIDEGEAESLLDKQEQLNEKIMTTTPFGQPVNNSGMGGGWTGPSSSPAPFSTPSFGQGAGTTPWGSRPTTPTWNPGGSSFQFGQKQQQQNQEINRKKRIIFCDFLDCMVESWDSNGRPGFLPRDIYDLKPRFEVWSKLAAFNPELVYAMIPINLIPNTNGAPGWIKTLEYFCCSLSSYLQLPWDSCKILAQSVIGQDKSELMKSILVDPRGIVRVNREDAIYVGVYSGLAGQSNRDQVAAQKCGIDYVDLGILLNNMY